MVKLFDSELHSTKSYVPCPTCRKRVPRPTNMQELVTNFETLAMIDNMPQSTHKKPQCSVHQHKQCTFLCLTCSACMCNSCIIKHKEHDIVEIEEAEDEFSRTFGQLAILKNNVHKAQQKEESELAARMDELNEEIRRRKLSAISLVDQWEDEMVRQVRSIAQSELSGIQNKFATILVHIDEFDGQFKRCLDSYEITAARTIKTELDTIPIPANNEYVSTERFTGDILVELGRLEHGGNSVVAVLFVCYYFFAYYR